MIERLIAVPRARITEYLDKREPRERMMLLGAGGVALVLLLWLGVYAPLAESIESLERNVVVARRDSQTIDALVERHRMLEREVAELERGTSPGNDASLFAQLESITVPVVGRERITAMNPGSRPVGERFEEETVDMRLEGIPMRELVKLLHSIEYRDPPMRLVRAAFKRQYKDPALLDATVVVARLRPR